MELPDDALGRNSWCSFLCFDLREWEGVIQNAGVSLCWSVLHAGANNYPWSTRQRNSYDVELPDDAQDAEYLQQLQQWLPELLQRHHPELVFYQSGVDALQEDSFGRWAVATP